LSEKRPGTSPELALLLGFLRLKQRLPFVYDLDALVYPTIEAAEDKETSKQLLRNVKGTRNIPPRKGWVAAKSKSPPI